MESMVERWKEKLSEMEDKPNQLQIPPHPPIRQETNENSPDHTLHQNHHSHHKNQMKKSVEKSKKSLHSQNSNDGKISKRMTTPSKKQNSTKGQIIEKVCEDIFEIFGKELIGNKTVLNRVKVALEDIWKKCSESLESASPRNLINIPTVTELDTSMMKESTLSAGTAKKQEKVYQDLEKKYFECEKERQFLKNKVNELTKQYENVDKEFERFIKMEKLIDKCIEREEEVKIENKRLKTELELAELKEIEQQKIFQKEINIVKELVEEIKMNLPST